MKFSEFVKGMPEEEPIFAGISIASAVRRSGHASMTTTQKILAHYSGSREQGCKPGNADFIRSVI